MATTHKRSPQEIAYQVLESNPDLLNRELSDDDVARATFVTAILLGIAAYNDKSNQLKPVADLEYPILNDDGTQLDDKGALFATVAKLSSVMNAQLVRDGQRELDAPLSAAASHGRMIGHALIARDLILAFIARNTQEGAL